MCILPAIQLTQRLDPRAANTNAANSSKLGNEVFSICGIKFQQKRAFVPKTIEGCADDDCIVSILDPNAIMDLFLMVDR